MLAAFLRRYILLHLVRKEDDANLIVVLDGREGDGGSYLGHHVTLHLHLRTKIQRAADVDQQHDGQFALFLKDLHVGTVEAGGYIPVDVTHVVTILILTNFAERHSPTLEG